MRLEAWVWVWVLRFFQGAGGWFGEIWVVGAFFDGLVFWFSAVCVF